MPGLARYLSVLEKQIDRLTEKLIVDDDEKLTSARRVSRTAAQTHRDRAAWQS
jgi:hypothetical protein